MSYKISATPRPPKRHSAPPLDTEISMPKKKNASLSKTNTPVANENPTLVLFKKYVCMSTHKRVFIYVIFLLIGSLLKDFEMVPTTYFSSKSNIFNLYFVKLGWLWTLLASIPWIILTNSARNSSTSKIAKHLMRALVATGLWYLFTSTFEYIDMKTGRCADDEFTTKKLCKSKKHDWIESTDISGHTFILMHSLFYLLEEIKAYFERQEDVDSSKSLKPYIEINFIFISFLVILWEIMLLSTFLYFHTLIHKLIAACVAIACWYFTYKYFYLKKLSFILPVNVAKSS